MTNKRNVAKLWTHFAIR